jgi:hypothetical protein
MTERKLEWRTDCGTVTPFDPEEYDHLYKVGDSEDCVECDSPVESACMATVYEMKETHMDIGEAIKAAKSGEKVSREGWNGKGMWIVHQKAYPNGIPINRNTAEATGIEEGTVCIFRPYLMMKAVDGSFYPWNPNVLDLLAEDWGVVSK